MRRERLTAVAGATALVLVVATTVVAQGRFTDTDDHSLEGDIDYAANEGWFSGYDDGSFRPDQSITDRQIATVVGRAFPDGATRAEMASFMRGGRERVESQTSLVYAGEGTGLTPGLRFPGSIGLPDESLASDWGCCFDFRPATKSSPWLAQIRVTDTGEYDSLRFVLYDAENKSSSQSLLWEDSFPFCGPESWRDPCPSARSYYTIFIPFNDREYVLNVENAGLGDTWQIQFTPLLTTATRD